MIIMEWTQALERRARGTQSYVAADDIDDVVGFFDLPNQPSPIVSQRATRLQQSVPRNLPHRVLREPVYRVFLENTLKITKDRQALTPTKPCPLAFCSGNRVYHSREVPKSPQETWFPGETGPRSPVWLGAVRTGGWRKKSNRLEEWFALRVAPRLGERSSSVQSASHP